MTSTFTRDVFGKPLTLTREGLYLGTPVSATRRYVYDANQRLCKTVEPESGATILAYNSADLVQWTASGQTLTSTTLCNQSNVAANQKVNYDYDSVNRLKTTIYGDNSPSVTRTYTEDGLLDTIESDNSRWKTLYNRRRLPTSQVLTLANETFPIGYTYSANGHVASLRYPDNSLVDYTPNALGEATRVGAYATAVTTHPNGALAGFTYGNGIAHVTEQNLRGLPSRSRDGSVLDDSYFYDANGNVSSIVDNLGGNFSRSMEYDARDRLSTVSNTPIWGGIQTYDYDPLDNLRRSRTQGLDWTHHYNTTTQRLERIANTAGGSNIIVYGHDARGRATSRTVGPTAQTFTIDLADRVTSVNPNVASYRYDGYGRRTTVSKAGASTVQVYSPAGQLLYQRSPAADGIFRDGFNGPDNYPPDTGGARRYIYLGRHLLAEESNNGRLYHHTDALGSPTRTTTATGTPSTRNLYQPYGWGPVQTSVPGFAGHVADAETGLSYMQARYYDPYAGRFLSVDPVAAGSGSFNRYWYANNNPYRFVDPDGRYVEAGFEAASLALDTLELHNAIQDGSAMNITVAAVVLTVDVVLAAVPLAPGVVGLGVHGTTEVATATARLSDDVLVVRGGSSGGANSVDGLRNGTSQHPEVDVGFSAESAEGAAFCDLCRNDIHNQVGVTTVGDVRAAGGDVVPTPGRSPTHVTVTGIGPEQGNKLLTPTRENPIPKSERRQFD